MTTTRPTLFPSPPPVEPDPRPAIRRHITAALKLLPEDAWWTCAADLKAVRDFRLDYKDVCAKPQRSRRK